MKIVLDFLLKHRKKVAQALLISSFGLLLKGLSGLGITLYNNRYRLQHISYQMERIEHDMENVQNAVKGVVTRASWDDYINHADIERDRQSDLNQRLLVRIGQLENTTKCR